jgi:hypothetical protein
MWVNMGFEDLFNSVPEIMDLEYECMLLGKSFVPIVLAYKSASGLEAQRLRIVHATNYKHAQ